jgi:hypothetical protein
MPLVGATPNIERPGVVCGFLITPLPGGLNCVVYPGVLFAQGAMYRPTQPGNPPAAPASQQSWLWRSSTAYYWRNTPTPETAGDALIGWVVTDAQRIVLVSRQEIMVPAGETNVTVVPLGEVLGAGPGAGNTYGDTDVPGQISRSLLLAKPGHLLMTGLGLPQNDPGLRSITTVTERVRYQDETAAATGTLTADVTAEATTFPVNSGAAFAIGYYVIDREIVYVYAKNGNDLSVNRAQYGSTAVAHKGPKSVTGATNATPIMLTAAAHGRLAGAIVEVSGVGGNTAANSRWEVGDPQTNSFELVGSSGNGDYTSGGTVAGTELHEVLDSYTVFAFEPLFFTDVERALNWTGWITLPSVWVVATVEWARNVFGQGEIWEINLSEEGNLHTRFGGELRFDVPGVVAVQDAVAAEITVPHTAAVHQVRAYVRTAPEAQKITAVVTRNGTPWAVMTIAPGETAAPARTGRALGAVIAGEVLALNISNAGTPFGGEDLVVVIDL